MMLGCRKDRTRLTSLEMAAAVLPSCCSTCGGTGEQGGIEHTPRYPTCQPRRPASAAHDMPCRQGCLCARSTCCLGPITWCWYRAANTRHQAHLHSNVPLPPHALIHTPIAARTQQHTCREGAHDRRHHTPLQVRTHADTLCGRLQVTPATLTAGPIGVFETLISRAQAMVRQLSTCGQGQACNLPSATLS